MDFDNLASGLIGSVLGILGAVIIEKAKSSRRVDRSRKQLITFLRLISKHHLVRYIDDCNAVIKLLENTKLKRGGLAHTFDTMPLLSSELFRTFGNETLGRVALTDDDFIKFVDSYYCIDYLKAKMPKQFFDEFTDWWWAHLKNHNDLIDKGKEVTKFGSEQEHFENCQQVADKRDFYVHDIKSRIRVAENLIKSSSAIITKYSNPDNQWDVEYFSR